MKSDIGATGTCFSDVVDYMNNSFLKLINEGKMEIRPGSPQAIAWASQFTICHGILLKEDGKPYSHAWIETKDDKVWHGGVVEGEKVWVKCDRTEYHKRMEVQEFTRYTPQQMMSLEQKHGRPGPWEERYRKLCRDVK